MGRSSRTRTCCGRVTGPASGPRSWLSKPPRPAGSVAPSQVSRAASAPKSIRATPATATTRSPEWKSGEPSAPTRPVVAIETRRPSPVGDLEISRRYGTLRKAFSPGVPHSRKSRLHCSQVTMASEQAATPTSARNHHAVKRWSRERARTSLATTGCASASLSLCIAVGCWSTIVAATPARATARSSAMMVRGERRNRRTGVGSSGDMRGGPPTCEGCPPGIAGRSPAPAPGWRAWPSRAPRRGR